MTRHFFGVKPLSLCLRATRFLGSLLAVIPGKAYPLNVILCDNPLKLIGASVLLLNGLLGFQVVQGAEVEISTLEEIASTELGSGFSLVNAAESGVNFVNRLDAELAIQNQILLNGSGVAVGDIDGDDLPDIYLCSLNGPNRLFRNKGRWQFEDITGKSKGIACEDQASFGAAMADMDGDGALNLLVTGLNSGVRYFENNRSGRFSEKTDRVGLRSNDGSASLAIADVNGDSSSISTWLITGTKRFGIVRIRILRLMYRGRESAHFF